MGLNYDPVFRRLWTKVHQIMSADAGEIVVCRAVFRLSTFCSVPESGDIRDRSAKSSEIAPKKACFSAPGIFFGGGAQIFDLVFKIAPISDHLAIAKFRGDRPRDRGYLALKKKKKQQQNIRAAFALSRNGRP